MNPGRKKIFYLTTHESRSPSQQKGAQAQVFDFDDNA
jgi:hypothetical protein